MLVKFMGISGKITERTYQYVIPQRLKSLISMSEIEINRVGSELGLGCNRQLEFLAAYWTGRFLIIDIENIRIRGFTFVSSMLIMIQDAFQIFRVGGRNAWGAV